MHRRHQFLRPLVREEFTAIRQNAALQASVLRDTSPVLSDLVKQKKLAIRAAVYDVGNGVVTML